MKDIFLQIHACIECPYSRSLGACREACHHHLIAKDSDADGREIPEPYGKGNIPDWCPLPDSTRQPDYNAEGRVTAEWLNRSQFNGWIHYTERLPKDGEWVLVCRKDGTVFKAGIGGVLTQDGWRYDAWGMGGGWLFEESPFWRPLPEPPSKAVRR